jgi:hypothetical protein
LAGSQFFCSFWTKDHFSSNWTSRVRGGKSHALVVIAVGVLSGGAGESDDGVAMDADESSGGADAATLVEVLKHGVGLSLRQMAAVERRAFAFGEAGPAAVAVELSELLVLAEAAADREVAGVTSAVEGTARILAAEAREVVHGVAWQGVPGRNETSGWKR